MKFSTIAALVADMDGVLWRGNQALPGLHELFDWLHESSTLYILATNNSTATRADYVAKLAGMGVPGVSEQSIITSSSAAADYMRQHYPAGTHVYVIGMQGIRYVLEEAGFDITESDDPVQVVVSGLDTGLTYDRLKKAAQYILAGADYICTNGDRTLPTADGLVPGAGSIMAALIAATDKIPVVIGKPYPPMYEAALHQLNLPAEKVLMLGDRLDTDIIGAQQAGMPTALVFTGVTQPEDLIDQQTWADVAYEDLPALLRAWAGDDWYRAKLRSKREQRV